MTHPEKAESLFKQGYTCAQAVIASFSDEEWFKKSGLSIENAMKIASSFGGGMGRLREVCGTVSGMFMLAGIAFGFDAPVKTPQEKQTHYARIQELASRFSVENGSIICRDLLGLSKKTETTGDAYSPKPEERTPEYYKKRPCASLCACAASIFEEYLKENGF